MKINLSKEHIERGCELVADYSMRIDDSDRGDFKEHLRYRGYRENIEDANSSLYRDFLQLVIEAINFNNTDCSIHAKSYYIMQRARSIVVSINKLTVGKKQVGFDYLGSDSITEAKEKALAYVFDNMDN